MSLNVEKHRDVLLAAWRDVLDENTDTNWALFGYEGMSDVLRLVSTGSGGLEELTDDLNSGKVMYAFLRLEMPGSSVAKYVLINWQGEGAPTVRKGTCAKHVQQVSRLMAGAHVTLHARTEDDLEPAVVRSRLATAGAAVEPRARLVPAAPAPPPALYHKLNPGKEINSKERDQFWLKEEQEEKNRVAVEKKRKEEEKRKAEEEVRRRDEQEAARRAQTEEQRSEKVGGVSASEALRRQRSAEAKQLIGVSTSAARAVFQQNLAQGQVHARSTTIPEKPIRNSVVAQRINSLTQQARSAPAAAAPAHSPAAAPAPAAPAPAPARASPVRNIDKIAMSLESPSRIQHEPIFDPSADLSPCAETEPSSFSAVTYSDYEDTSIRTSPRGESIVDDEKCDASTKDGRRGIVQSEPMIKQNILDNDMFDASHSSSSNDNDDDDSDNKFSTIKRSPYSKSSAGVGKDGHTELSRQDTVIENVHYKKEPSSNGNTTLEDISPEGMDDDGIYQDLDDDPGLTARALYDYQAADNTEITFDPGDIITHIDQIDEGWWQGLGPHGVFGLFPANYVALLPAEPR